MNTTFVWAGGLAMICSLFNGAQGALIVQEPVLGEQVVLDEDTNLMWTRNALLGGGNWWNANAWAESLVYAGFDDWRLPNADPACGISPCPSSEMGHLAVGHGITALSQAPFFNISTVNYWTRQEVDGDEAWRHNFGQPAGFQTFWFKIGNNNGWAVRQATVVPIPAIAVMVPPGLGLLVIRRPRRI